LWDRFAADQIGVWQQIWKGFGPRTWNISDQPEVLALDLEMVTFVEAKAADQRHAAVFARRFAMLHTDAGWVVASVNGGQLFRPGWPPTLGQRAGS
jgi:hypothetical protein